MAGRQASPRSIVLAALVYFGLVFLAGFVLGTIRVLLLAPWIGSFAAIAIELPIMLAFSGVVAGPILRRFAITRIGDALAMGALAFVLLMAAEFALALLLGAEPSAYVAAMATPAGLLGLAGQAGFAALPPLLAALRRRQ